MNSTGIRMVLAFVAGIVIVSALALTWGSWSATPGSEPAAAAPTPAPPPAPAPAEKVPVPAPAPQPAAAAAAGPAPAPAAAAMADVKIGVVNLKDCFDKDRYAHVKDLEDKLLRKREDTAKELKAMETELIALKDKMESLSPDSTLFQELRQQFVILSAQKKAKADVAAAELKEEFRRSRAEIYEEVLHSVRFVSQERKLDLVLKADAPPAEEDDADKGALEMRVLTRGVLFHTDPIDITADVLKKLNQLYEQRKAKAVQDNKKEDATEKQK